MRNRHNGWGFAALVFTGILLDAAPELLGQPLVSTGVARALYVAMTVGAIGLVAGPWAEQIGILAPGLLVHLAATIFFAVQLIRRVRETGTRWTPGQLHLVSAYLWILAPIVIAPLVVMKVDGFAAVGIEANAPQALIYGWALQMSYALLPWAFSRALQRDALHGVAYALWALSAVPMIKQLAAVARSPARG